jgi:hypothetical protein
MNILQRLLTKRQIKSKEELTPDEKSQFENWEKILSKDELTIEDLKTFCKSQIDVIEGKWRDLNVDQSKKAELIPYHTVYKTLEAALLAPKAAREALEQHLNQLIN